MKNFAIKELLEELENNMDVLAVDFCNNEPLGFLDDCIMEYADNNTSIYYADQEKFYWDNRAFCDNIAIEHGLLESFNRDSDSIGDLIFRAGSLGEFEMIYRELETEIENIKLYLVYKTLEELNISHINEKEQAKAIEIAQDFNSSQKIEELKKIIIEDRIFQNK